MRFRRARQASASPFPLIQGLSGTAEIPLPSPDVSSETPPMKGCPTHRAWRRASSGDSGIGSVRVGGSVDPSANPVWLPSLLLLLLHLPLLLPPLLLLLLPLLLLPLLLLLLLLLPLLPLPSFPSLPNGGPAVVE